MPGLWRGRRRRGLSPPRRTTAELLPRSDRQGIHEIRHDAPSLRSAADSAPLEVLVRAGEVVLHLVEAIRE